MIDLYSFEFLGTAFSVVGVLLGDGFAFRSTLKDHVALELGKTQHDITDEFARRRVVDDAHVENINNNALVAESFKKLDALNETSSNAIQLRNDERVPVLDDLQ